MKKYIEYMDGVSVSDTLHQRLLALESYQKRPAWMKYGAMAAALLLAAGLGGFAAWAAQINGLGAPIPFYPPGFQQAPEAADANAEPGIPDVDLPELADIARPDIAPEEPGDAVEPGMKTIGGYEVRQGDMVPYYVLPYIEYGMPEEQFELCLDWDVPPGAVKKELTRDEIIALMGNEDAVNIHLDWGMYALTGWAAWYEDGSFWGAYINGLLPNYDGPTSEFEFAVTSGALPPTCIVYPESVEQEIWGISVTADGYDSVACPGGGVDASSRRVSFTKDSYGCRFDITGSSRALTEERVSRLVRWIATEGLALDTLSADGAEPAHP